MVQYPDCPFCGNASLSIVDVEINGISLKGVQCNACSKFIGYYKDNDSKIKEISESIEDIDSRIRDLE